MAIEKYLNAVRLYVKYLEGGDLEQALEYAKKTWIKKPMWYSVRRRKKERTKPMPTISSIT